MNISKKLKFLIIFVFFIFSSFSILKAEEKVNLDDEELPAIDPFQGNTVNMNQGQSVDQNNSNIGGGLLNGMKLVGTIIGEKKKFAILSRPDGNAFRFEENQRIVNKVMLIEIYNDYLVVEDENGKLFQVYMNNLIKEIEG